VQQDYLGQKLEKPYYMPKSIGREKSIAEYMEKLRNHIQQMRKSDKNEKVPSEPQG
jgi:replication-associated recombination protein RarA